MTRTKLPAVNLTYCERLGGLANSRLERGTASQTPRRGFPPASLLLILNDRAAPSYQLLNFSLADLFFGNPFTVPAFLSFDLGTLVPSDLDNCLLPINRSDLGIPICLSRSSRLGHCGVHRLRPVEVFTCCCCWIRRTRFMECIVHQPGFAPENFTTLAHFSVSSRISFPNSVGDVTSVGAPSSTSRFLIWGSASAALISLFSFSIISVGVFRGPRRRAACLPHSPERSR